MSRPASADFRRMTPGALALVACLGLLASCSPPGALVTVEVVGDGLGFVDSAALGLHCPGDCTQVFPVGEGQQLRADEGQAGSTFLGWAGGSCSGTGACAPDPSSDVKVVAAFARGNSLVVARVGSGDGVVRSEPAGIDCSVDCVERFPAQTQVTLTASPGPNSKFDGWSGACTGLGPCVVSAAQAQLVAATFSVAPREAVEAMLGQVNGLH